ncbi:MAG: NAD(P)H:quinone oxidoreductase [Propionibacteriales bacterium]|nr:NAD(P)H:quinone oxidoreductase [Propionibacteriales bacterium]
MTRIAVIYYSSTGTTHALAEAYAQGAVDSGAEVRLRRAPELAPRAVIDRSPEWAAHLSQTDDIPDARPDDLVWADGFALGTPTRFGNPAAQLKQFIDTTGGIWEAGELAGKPGTTFTSSYETHGGQESTLLSLHQVLHHWGAVILPPGYRNYDLAHAAGGNPYGISHVSGDGPPGNAVLEAARAQGRLLAETARALTSVRTRDREAA